MAAPARADLAPQRDSAPAAQPRAPREIPALDGLRGVAVLLVIWCHVSGLTFTPSTAWLLDIKATSGFLGLYLFFVLSGFLLFLPYANALIARAQWPSARRFYERRMLRILPVYYVALSVPIAIALLKPNWGLVPPLPGAGALLALYTLLHNLNPHAWGFVLGTDTPLWSLTVEWEFYLILPLLALGLRLLARRFGAAGVIAGLLGLMAYGLIVRAVAAATFYQYGYPTVMQVPGPPGLILTLLFGMNGNYLELFALGMLASLVYVGATAATAATALAWAKNAARMTRTLTILTAISVLIGIPLYILFLRVTALIPAPAAAFVGRWPQEAPSAWTWSIFGPWLLAVLLAVVLLCAVLGPAWFRRLWAWRPLRLVGLISYSLYVWHALLQRFWVPIITLNGRIAVPALVQVGLYLLILLLLGIGSYRYIERPFLQVRKGQTPPIVAGFRRLAGRRGRPAPASTTASR
jgi:peptidoglycan/LPS O-acetylase OafA/YrhL